MNTERALLTARLAATCARLWRALIGVDAQSLTAMPVVGDWTAANLLAHVGEYDVLVAAQTSHAIFRGRL